MTQLQGYRTELRSLRIPIPAEGHLFFVTFRYRRNCRSTRSTSTTGVQALGPLSPNRITGPWDPGARSAKSGEGMSEFYGILWLTAHHDDQATDTNRSDNSGVGNRHGPQPHPVSPTRDATKLRHDDAASSLTPEPDATAVVPAVATTAPLPNRLTSSAQVRPLTWTSAHQRMPNWRR